MGRTFLVLLLVVEGAVVALLFLLLLVWPIVRRVAEARRVRQRADLLAAVGDRREGGDIGRVQAALARCRPGVLLRALDTIDEEGIGPDDLDLDRLVRATPAFRRVEGAAGSLLWWRRQTAAQLLERVGRPAADQPLLLALVRDAHPGVSTAARMAARRLGWPELAEPLLDLAVEEGTGHRGEEELLRETLADLDTDVVPALRHRLKAAARTPNEVTLLRIAERLGDERLLPLLRDRLRHGGLEVRIQSAKTIAAIGDPAAADELQRALEDAAWQVRTQAARALGELQVDGAADDLRRALSDPSWWVRLRAALALRKLGAGGRDILAGIDPEVDPYAADMAGYVLDLEDAAVHEYGR